MKEFAAELSNLVNKYIEKGLTAEEICGCLAGAGFRVMQAAGFAEAESGGGDSPVQKVFGEN